MVIKSSSRIRNEYSEQEVFMLIALKASSAIGFVGLALLAVLQALKHIFDLTLIYGAVYFILGFLVFVCAIIAFILLKTLCRKRYLLFRALTIVVIVITLLVFIYYLMGLAILPRPDSRMFFETVESGRIVYFESEGFFFMTNFPYYRLEEADVRFLIFYTNRRTVVDVPGP